MPLRQPARSSALPLEASTDRYAVSNRYHIGESLISSMRRYLRFTIVEDMTLLSRATALQEGERVLQLFSSCRHV